MFRFLFAIFVPAPGIEVITKLDVAHQAPHANKYLQPLLAFVPKASKLKLRRKYCGVVSH
jgi:hypothetical protein